MTPDASQPVHQPVLLKEAIEWLQPRRGGVYCDATVGFGGHATAILEASAPDGRLLGLDRDLDALTAAGQRLAGFGSRVNLVHAPFSRLRSVAGHAGALPLDGCLVDLGVSSAQLDRPERGFSFRRNGPLDMRMDRSGGLTATEYLATVSETDLTQVLRDFGEERHARGIARSIVEARRHGPIDSTAALAALVSRAVPRREHHKDPSTRTFQALRIVVNRELDELERFLDDAPECLAPGGRLVVIAFHSLEDRMVKHRLRALALKKGEAAEAGQGPRLRILTKHVVVPGPEESESNPRARSARLRAAERIVS